MLCHIFCEKVYILLKSGDSPNLIVFFQLNMQFEVAHSHAKFVWVSISFFWRQQQVGQVGQTGPMLVRGAQSSGATQIHFRPSCRVNPVLTNTQRNLTQCLQYASFSFVWGIISMEEKSSSSKEKHDAVFSTLSLCINLGVAAISSN